MKFALLTTSFLTMAAVASAGPINLGPPAGALLDLNGDPISHGSFTQYSVNFTATLTSTAITFAIREDPAFIFLENTSVVDTTTSSGNLLLNGDFGLGTVGSLPLDWTFANVNGASFSGVVDASNSGSACGSTPASPVTNCWYDGSVQAYDTISQTIATTIGNQYQISFFVEDNGSLTTFSDLSTNGDTTDTGGNGADVVVYGGAPVNLNAPEPATYGLVGLGLVGVGVIRARRSRKA
jgi:hypothetical protein